MQWSSGAAGSAQVGARIVQRERKDGRATAPSPSMPNRRGRDPARAAERSAGYASDRVPSTIDSATSAAFVTSASTSARGSRNLPST
jgi:hypothetical protein